jgi:hypothetical protein
VSQMLTLFTTPVIYLTFDRIAIRYRAKLARFTNQPAPGTAP